METLLKCDGFLPAANDSASASTLYRVNLMPAETAGPSVQCIVLLVDISGSMSSHMSNLKAAILSTVDIILARGIATLDQIVLIPFDSFSCVYRDFKGYRDFEAIVSRLAARGGTDYGSAIVELSKLLDQRGEAIAVMFSDGYPNNEYESCVEELKTVASDKSLLFHSIGLETSHEAEKILRNLTTLGSTEGFFQSIGNAEITASMNVLVDHFNCTVEPLVNGSRTRNGFVVSAETEHFVAQLGGKEVALEVVNSSFKEMLDENSFEAILDVLHFLLEYHLKSVAATFERAIAIVDHVSSLIGETEKKVKSLQQEKRTAFSNEKNAKIDSIDKETGAGHLRQQSEIISEFNRNIGRATEEYSKLVRNIHELKELCAQIQETLHTKRHITTSISGEVMDVVSKFRDNSIALKRKHMARISSKVREENEKFQNIDKLLQDELDQLVKLESIPVPEYFQNYSDPITLNSFEDIMLSKFGVFMLLINIERHDYGITAPHRTKIISIGGFSSSVLDVMMNNKDKSVFFDFRGIGFGNAAVPLWISDLHWQKARHVFGPFVGYAVTGNELEYTRLQGMTLLALILLHLRQQESTEFNRQLIQMVSQTLDKVIDRNRWETVANDMGNSFDKLNESIIPCAEVFLVFQEFISADFPKEKALLLLAEHYRRVHGKRIKETFAIPTRRPFFTYRSHLLHYKFPTVNERYLNLTKIDAPVSSDRRNKENYFPDLYDGKSDSRLLNWFDDFCQKLGPSLSVVASSLEDKQKIAIILSVHKCTLFTWEALDEVPAGLSYASDYPDLLLGWCRRAEAEKEQNLSAAGDEGVLLQILQTGDEFMAETLMRGVKRNDHTWAALIKVLLPSNKVRRAPKLTHEQWEQCRVESYQKLIEKLSVPLHLQLIMFCIFDSVKPEYWSSYNMVWRPKYQLRRRIRTMFPTAPAIE